MGQILNMHFAVALLGLNFISQIFAIQPVVTVPLYGYDNMSGLDGSVVGANDQATTLSIQCLPGTDSSDCGLAPQQVLVIGPSTYNMNMADGNDFTGAQQCVRFATTEAVCQESAGGAQANFPGSSTVTYTGTDISFAAVTITGGADKLTGVATATPTTSQTPSAGNFASPGAAETSSSAGKSASSSAAKTPSPASASTTTSASAASKTSQNAVSSLSVNQKSAVVALFLILLI